MTDRMSVYSDPDIIALLRDKFVPVVQDDWYARRSDDALGEFFRGVADQGPRKGEGGATRQGSYAFTASGKLLAYNNNRSLERRRAMIDEALAKWNQLPRGETQPGGATVPRLPDSQRDRRYYRTIPDGGIALRTFTRVLRRDDNGTLQTCEPPDDSRRRGYDSAFDHVWIKEQEWRELVKTGLGATDKPAPVPGRLARRLVRFHLVDNTRGEPPMWKNSEIIRLRMTVSNAAPERGSNGKTTLRLDGEIFLATSTDPAEADRGFDARMRGTIEVDTESGSLERFDAVVIGDHWGDGRFTRGARPGRTPLGIVFELADGSEIGDSVPPQAIRWEEGYYEAERH